MLVVSPSTPQPLAKFPYTCHREFILEGIDVDEQLDWVERLVRAVRRCLAGRIRFATVAHEDVDDVAVSGGCTAAG